MKESAHFRVDEIGGLRVVRDDTFEGGTKRRAFAKIINTIGEPELVYACDYYGHAAYAVALEALKVRKKVKVFYLSPLEETDIFLKTVALTNVDYEIVDGASTQIEASKTAIEYADNNMARFLTIGLDFQLFRDALLEVIRSAKIDDAKEIWCVGGSGTLARTLKAAYPNASVNVVSVGTANAHFEGVDNVYEAPETLHEKAEIPPPYTSSPHYDAKTWRFILQHASKGAYVWNVA